MGLNETMSSLREENRPQAAPMAKDEPMELPDEMPTIRDLSTALYRLTQEPSCRNCIRRERGDCPSKKPMPKSCHSFQLNSKQMQTYGQQARNAIKAWRDAISIFHERKNYQIFKGINDE